MRMSAGARASAVSTAARGPSLYAIASRPFWVVEVGVFNTTTTAFTAAVQRATATGTQGAAITGRCLDDDAITPAITPFNTHTADATITTGFLTNASIGAAVGAGVIWTFGKNGVKCPAATTNGIVITAPTGTGQLFDWYIIWEE